MNTPVASIVIPTYNHAAFVADAIESALAQTVACEAIVVDDGSTDETSRVLQRYAAHPAVRVIALPHGGPSIARNAGLTAARGAYVMFLDADDVLVPTKIARQVAELAAHPEAGWVFCDVAIEDASKGRRQIASARYAYAQKELSGWIAPLLEPGNFIPIMAPLIRREVLADLRFVDSGDGTPEDWRFWQAVSRVARVRYVPAVLATYRKQRTGRNRLPAAGRALEPNIVQPLRLNLGTPGQAGWQPLPGFVNLHPRLEWWRDPLAFPDRSVAGITIAPILTTVPVDAWARLFSEITRVLVDGGIVRLADRSGDESPIAEWLERFGLSATAVTSTTSHFADLSLCHTRGDVDPCVVEGVKRSGVLFAPHNDDETLFAAFTILRYRPRVVVCYPSTGDYGDPAVRAAETQSAMDVLGASAVEQWPGGDVEAAMRELEARLHPARVWAPHPSTSHPDHEAVAAAAVAVFGDRVSRYHTYIDGKKIRRDVLVPCEPEWVGAKLRALARYTSQWSHPRAHRFFLEDLYEYAEGR